MQETLLHLVNDVGLLFTTETPLSSKEGTQLHGVKEMAVPGVVIPSPGNSM